MVEGSVTLSASLWPFALLLPWAALVWYRREWAVFLLLGLLPTYLWRVSLAGIPTTWFELALYLTTLSLVVHGDWQCLRGKGWQQIQWWLPPVALWLAAAGIGVLVAPDVRLALGIFKGWIADPLLVVSLLWIVFQKTPDPLKFFYRSTGSLLVGATLTSVWALLAGAASGLQRFSAWYDSPNVLAMYLVPVAVVAMLWLATTRRAVRLGRIEQWVWYGAILLVVAAIISTGSYGAWLALAMGLLVGWCYQRPKTQALARWLGKAVFIVGLTLPWVVVSVGQWPFVSHLNATYQVSSGQVRFVLWREATHLIGKHPLVGVGLGQWQQVFDTTIRPYLAEVRNPGYAIELHYASLFPHNLWLTAWLSLGVVGLVALAWYAAHLYRRRVQGSYLVALPVALITTILAQGWFDTPVFKNDLAVLFWLPFVMVAVVEASALEVH